MRILVVTSSAPFVRGGHMVIVEETVSALRRAGHEAEVFQTPTNRFGRQFDAYKATALTDVSEGADGKKIDRIITFRYPSYALRHPVHVNWLNHTMREYYDLWDDLIAGMGRKGRLKEMVRRFWIQRLDRSLLTRNVSKLFTQSNTISERLRHFINVEGETLYPPAPARAYRCVEFQPFVFGVSRLHHLKRFDWLLRAMKAVKGLRAVIAGEGEAEGRLKKLAGELGVSDRVTFVGNVTDEEKLDFLSRCSAVFFAPKNEDYGFVTLEAMSSGKPVLTAHDSGGPTELVRHGENGWILRDPEEFGTTLRSLAENPTMAAKMKTACERTAQAHTWERVVSRLTE